MTRHHPRPLWHYGLIGGFVTSIIGFAAICVTYATENAEAMMALALPFFFGLIFAMGKNVPPFVMIAGGALTTLVIYFVIGALLTMLVIRVRRVLRS
ncbi:MAG: hypothetical protein KBD00_01290 [Candidatus Peribacteraceae bacterium]|nr:hypothetical protein [Candidatus Peribacteraceae bacterium]